MEPGPTQLVGRLGSPVRMSNRDVSPRRSYVQKKNAVTANPGPVVVTEEYQTPYYAAT